jgi:hypothetical protein
MSLPGPIESETMPFAISCTDYDSSGGLEEESTLINEVSIIETIDMTFFIMTRTDLEPPTVPPTTPLPEWVPISITVTAVTPTGHGLDVNGTRYSGLYSTSVFPSSSITYLDADYDPNTVASWSDVPDKDDPNFFQIQIFTPSNQGSATVTYHVTAVIEKDGVPETLSKTYTQTVTNNWTGGQNDLLKYM